MKLSAFVKVSFIIAILGVIPTSAQSQSYDEWQKRSGYDSTAEPEGDRPDTPRSESVYEEKSIGDKVPEKDYRVREESYTEEQPGNYQTWRKQKQDTERNRDLLFGFEFHGHYTFKFDDSLFTDAWEGALGIGTSFCISPASFCRIDIGVDYFKTKSDEYSSCKLTIIPITAGIRLGVPLEPVFIYGGGGGGYSFNDTSGWSLAWELENSPIYYACGGAEIFFVKNIAFRIEYRYNWIKPELKQWGSKYANLELNHMQVRAGLGLYF